MGRRGWLIVCVIVEMLLLLWDTSAPLHVLPYGFGVFVIGGVTTSVASLLTAVPYALAIVVGALSRRWQGAIALNLIALLPAFLVIMFVSSATGSNLGSALFLFAEPLAALGWTGWLLRFVRAELTA